LVDEVRVHNQFFNDLRMYDPRSEFGRKRYDRKNLQHYSDARSACKVRAARNRAPRMGTQHRMSLETNTAKVSPKWSSPTASPLWGYQPANGHRVNTVGPGDIGLRIAGCQPAGVR